MSNELQERKGIFVKSTRVERGSVETTMKTLYPGDTVEYGITHQVEMPDRTSMWIKVHSSTTVQQGESSQDTADRLVTFVHDQMKDRIVQAANHAGELTLD